MPSSKSKTSFGLYCIGSFLILVVAVLVSCSSFDVSLKQVGKGKLHQKKHHQHSHRHHRNQNENEFEFFDANGKAKPEAIRRELFGGDNNKNIHHHDSPKSNNINFNKKHTPIVTEENVDDYFPSTVFNSSSSSSSSSFSTKAPKHYPLGTAVTFSPNFFKNMFNVVIMPSVRKLVQQIHINGESFGVPGPGGKGSISNVVINQFDIQVGELLATAPNQFDWSLSDIELEISFDWSVKWELKLCPCFGGCCFHITLFHCSGPFEVNTNNMKLSGTMTFSYDESTSTVQVDSPANPQWTNVPTIHISAKCGWFWDAILKVLKFFGLNIWKDVQNAINKAIASGFDRNQGLLGSAMNKFLDQTLNAALNGFKICNFKFYEGQNYMSIFTRDELGACLDTILPPNWMSNPPPYDITVLGRIELFPTFFPPTNWSLACLPLPQKWFSLPGGLSTLMDIDKVTICLGLDNTLGVYVVGQVNVKFLPPTSVEIQETIAPYLQLAQKQLEHDRALAENKFETYVENVSGEYQEKYEKSGEYKTCPFQGGVSHLFLSSNDHKNSGPPWWTCANIPLLEKVLSWLPAFLIVFTLAAVIYRARETVLEEKKKEQEEDRIVELKKKHVVEF